MFVGSSPQACITSKFLVVLVYMDKYFQIIHMVAKRHKSINQVYLKKNIRSFVAMSKLVKSASQRLNVFGVEVCVTSFL